MAKGQEQNRKHIEDNEKDMSENTNSSTEQVVTDENILGFKLVEESFHEGPWNGFKFYVPQFPSVDKAVAHLGGDTVLDTLNQAAGTRIRQAVKNGLIKNASAETLKAEQAKVLANSQGVLFSKEDAVKWRPSFRDGDGAGLGSITKQLEAAMKAGDMAKVQELLGKFVNTAQDKLGDKRVDLSAVVGG